MPIYEYKCLSCDAHIEIIQKTSDEALKVCETCGGELEKLLSLSGFQFKGDGWYVTDYGNKKGKGDAESSKPKSDTESTKSEKSASKEGQAPVKTETETKKE